MLDAYTVRKAIPRIVIAVIGINLSIYLCVVMIDITNIIGNGLGNLISTPFVGDGIQVAPGAEKIQGNIVNGGVLAVIFGVIIKSLVVPGPIAILASLFPLLLIVGLVALSVLFTLIIRQGLLLFLTVTSPVAIALFILPGTEKYFKKWFDLFVKTLLVYPIIAVLFAVSNAMFAIMIGQANGNGGDGTILRLIAGIVVLYAPLVMIPFAFKLAGGAISAVMNAAQGTMDKKRRGLAEGRAKGLTETAAERKAKLKAGQLYEGRKWIPGSESAARKINRAGLSVGTGLRGHYGLGQTGANARANALELATAEKMKSPEMLKIKENDHALRAGTFASESLALAGLQEEGLTKEQSVNAIQQFKTSGMRFGDRSAQQAAAKQMVMTGTSFDKKNGMEDMVKVLARASGGNASSAASLAGFANAYNKQVGRWELAPSYSALNDLVQAEAGTDAESADFKAKNPEHKTSKTARARTFDEATLKAIHDSTDPGTLARTAKPQVFSNLNEVIKRAEDRGDDDLLHTARQIVVEVQSNRYGTAGAATDQIDVQPGPEVGEPRLYGGNMDPRIDPRNRPQEPPKTPPES